MKTFVVRIVDDVAGPDPAETLRGVVDEIGTGLRVTFSSNAELVAVLAGALRRAAAQSPGEGTAE